MDSAPPAVITTPTIVDNQHIGEITRNLKALGHDIEPHQVVGVTDQTPMPRTKELQDVGADITGEDLTHLIATTVAMQPGLVRATKSSNPLKLFINKLIRKKNVDQDIIEQ